MRDSNLLLIVFKWTFRIVLGFCCRKTVVSIVRVNPAQGLFSLSSRAEFGYVSPYSFTFEIGRILGNLTQLILAPN